MKRKVKNTLAKGIRFEHKTKKFLEQYGAFCVRSASSSFPDLTSFLPSKDGKPDVLWVECKCRGRISKEERRKLLELSSKYGGTPYIAYPFKHKGRAYVGLELVK